MFGRVLQAAAPEVKLLSKTASLLWIIVAGRFTLISQRQTSINPSISQSIHQGLRLGLGLGLGLRLGLGISTDRSTDRLIDRLID